MELQENLVSTGTTQEGSTLISDMARYHFNIRDREGLTLDDEGSEFELFEEALDEAKASARDLARQLIASSTAVAEQCIEITDDGGIVLKALPVAEVVKHPNYPKFEDHC